MTRSTGGRFRVCGITLRASAGRLSLAAQAPLLISLDVQERFDHRDVTGQDLIDRRRRLTQPLKLAPLCAQKLQRARGCLRRMPVWRVLFPR